MNGHPIDPFLAAWSAASGVDGFAFRLRVYRALDLSGPWTRNRLKSVLASLLVPDARQRDRFETLFDNWFLRDETSEQPLAPADVRAWLDELARKLGPPKPEPPEPAPLPQPPPIPKRQRAKRNKRRIDVKEFYCGVCNGIAAYFDIDVTIVRIVFGILAFMWGAGVPLYLIMMFVVPVAETPSENAAAASSFRPSVPSTDPIPI